MAQQEVAYTTAPVVSQPVAYQQTTVVINRPTAWSSGICGCFDDMKSCCCSYWLGACFYGCLAQRMGEHCCVGLCGNGLVPGGHIAMRAAFRNKHGIQGDICSDCCMTMWCLPCAMCQLSREMDRLGYPDNCC